MFIVDLLDPPVAIVEAEISSGDGIEYELFDGERAALINAIPKRQAEFRAGRICARRAMEMLGELPAAILAGTDRAPIWPANIAGSITHTGSHCAAAIARKADGIRAIGIDLETDAALTPELCDGILLESERRWLETQPSSTHTQLATLIFSAKESAYKCQYALTQTLLDFTDLEISINLPANTFTARFTRPVTPFNIDESFSGRWRHANRHIATAVIISER